MNTTSQLREIYQKALKETKSKETLLGMFKGMLMMYQQDDLPKKDILEIKKIIQEIKQEIKREM